MQNFAKTSFNNGCLRFLIRMLRAIFVSACAMLGDLNDYHGSFLLTDTNNGSFSAIDFLLKRSINELVHILDPIIVKFTFH